MSNEIFYEIFDYLDGYDIYKTFTNLNIRFENLLDNSLFLIKIQLSSTSVFDHHYEEFINLNKNHIRSFHFFNESVVDKFISLCIINSSFIRLESLVLDKISTFKLVVLLFYLKSLPRFFSLTINLGYCFDDLGDIYQIIFHLPFLKYLKIDISEYDQLNITVPIAVGEQFSPIESLVICHCCPLDELTDLLSYTPRLSHLYCSNVVQSDNEIKFDVLMKLTNLIHLTVGIINELDFDEFEECLVKLCSQLKLFKVTIRHSNRNFLDSDRWKQLILQYMPHLNRFIFCYIDVIDDDFQMDPCHSLINGFTSSFWIDRKWIFKILVENDKLVYLIRPYEYILKKNSSSSQIFRLDFFRKTWIDYQEYIPNENGNCSDHYFSIVQLRISGNLFTSKDELILDRINPIFDMIQLTCLDIHCDQMSINMVIQILNLLPNLLSLRISDFPFQDPINTRDPDMQIWETFLENNKITKFTISNIKSIEDVTCIIILFPRIQYLALQYVADVDLKSVVRCALLQIKENDKCHLTTICIFGLEVEHSQVRRLRRMINSRKLLKNYTINRQLNRFYLQWK